MIYQIKNKYYIKVAPYLYKEIDFILTNDSVTIKTLSNKIEITSGVDIKQIDFQKEKDSIKKQLLTEKNKEEKTYDFPRNNKHRNRA